MSVRAAIKSLRPFNDIKLDLRDSYSKFSLTANPLPIPFIRSSDTWQLFRLRDLRDFPTRRYSARTRSNSKKHVIYSCDIPIDRLALSRLRWLILIYKLALRAVSKLKAPLVVIFGFWLISSLDILVLAHFFIRLPNSSSYLLFKLAFDSTNSSRDWHETCSSWGLLVSKTVIKWLKGV